MFKDLRLKFLSFRLSLIIRRQNRLLKRYERLSGKMFPILSCNDAESIYDCIVSIAQKEKISLVKSQRIARSFLKEGYGYDHE